MNSKILLSMLALGVASAGMGYGTYAFFSDTEIAAGNIFTAGDLDLTLNGQNGVTATLAATNFAPGDSVTGSVMLRNEGSITTGDAQGHVVDLDVRARVAVVDDAGNPADPDDGGVSSVGLDRYLVLSALSYGGSDLLPSVSDADSDGRVTLADLAARGVIADLADPGAAGKALAMTVTFAPEAPNHLKRDAATLDLTFFLSQAGEVDLA